MEYASRLPGLGWTPVYDRQRTGYMHGMRIPTSLSLPVDISLAVHRRTILRYACRTLLTTVQHGTVRGKEKKHRGALVFITNNLHSISPLPKKKVLPLARTLSFLGFSGFSRTFCSIKWRSSAYSRERERTLTDLT